MLLCIDKTKYIWSSNVGTVWPFAHMKTACIRKSTLHAGSVGIIPEERVEFEMSNPRDPWNEFEMTLKIFRAIGLFPALD